MSLMHVLPETMLASASPGAPRCAFEAPVRNLVLLVEDNDCVAGLVTCILGRGGRRVLRARDGAESELLFAAHAREIACVMLDYRLPDTDGASLCARLRRQRPDLPVMFASGQDYAGQRTFADGITRFVAKPFLPAELAREVSALLAAIA